MSDMKLLPCPFCGAIPESSVIGEAARYLLLCDTCGVTTAYHEGIDATIAAWNTRTPDPRNAAAQGLADALKRTQILVRVLTVRAVLDDGNSAIEAAGLNPWCVNEGLADGDEHISPWWIDAALTAWEEAQ